VPTGAGVLRRRSATAIGSDRLDCPVAVGENTRW